MILKQFKIKARVLFIVSLASIALLAVVFWNSLLKAEASISVIPVFLLVAALGSVSWFYVLYLKETNESVLKDIIDTKIKEERAKILAEFSKKEEVIEDVKVDMDELISKIMPKGNFKNADSFILKFIQNLAPEIEMSLGAFFIKKEDDSFEFLNGYALTKEEIPGFKAGENLTGQVAVSKEIMVLHDIPEEYLNIESGLGRSKPTHLIIVPFISDGNVIAILEIASFKSNTSHIVEILNKLSIQVSDKLVQMLKS